MLFNRKKGGFPNEIQKNSFVGARADHGARYTCGLENRRAIQKTAPSIAMISRSTAARAACSIRARQKSSRANACMVFALGTDRDDQFVREHITPL